jgi:uncharacterized protein
VGEKNTVKKWLKRFVLWILLPLVLLFAVMLALNWNIVQRVMLGGLHVHETVPPAIPADLKRPAILVFSKTNGFRHEEAIPAGKALFARMAKDKGWGYFETENGAAFSPEILAKFDAVVFNNTSGDVFSAPQQQAFKAFIENGGGYLGLHAAGDSSHEGWKWYTNELIGAHFTQHTMSPQFQLATVKVEDTAHPVTKFIPPSWMRVEEWYSFAKSPRGDGVKVLISVDEKTYQPVGMFGKDLRMGDHPAVWSRCIGKGRVVYSIFGHKAEAFAEGENVTLLDNALTYAIDRKDSSCPTSAQAAEPAKASAQ